MKIVAFATTATILLHSNICGMVGGWHFAHRHDLAFPITIRHLAHTLIYFGNATSEPQYQAGIEQQEVCRVMDRLRQQLGLRALFYPKLVHGTKGLTIRRHLPAPRTKRGDFIMTNEPLIGLAIASADCLPIIYIDPEHRAVALAHAGWRGTADKIASEVINSMTHEFGSRPEELRIIFGPSTRCFGELSVQQATWHGLQVDDESTVVRTRAGDLLLDLSVLNRRQLVASGVDADKICTLYNVCTKCDPQFCSHEREPDNPHRQFCVVALAP